MGRPSLPIHWSIGVGLLCFIAAVGPLVFGVPVLGNWMAMDANFALQLVRGYSAAIAAHQLLPRWLPSGNGGLGSPVFYFYGRLPFLTAGVLAAILRIQPPGATILTMAAFRVAAFWACRAWLRRHVPAMAADCGALIFLALPYAMSYNPLGRVGFAEVAATAFLPLLLIAVECAGPTLRRTAWSALMLAVLFALLAATHLPQTVLAIGVVVIYGVLLRRLNGLVSSIAGALTGVLLSAPNILPAVQMQPLVTPAAWTGGATGDVRNQFLFTLSRLHLYHFLAQEFYLYGTWLLCFALLLPFLAPSLRSTWFNGFTRAVLILLLLSLTAMTRLFEPVWVLIPQLRAIQFPWRMMPAAMLFAGGAGALLLVGRSSATRIAMPLLAMLIGLQVAIPTLGAFASLSHSNLAPRFPDMLRQRLPAYVAWRDRDVATYAARRGIVPEYVPSTAREAGWHLDETQTRLLLGAIDAMDISSQPLPSGLTRSGDGFLMHIAASAPRSILLPMFYFPDERVMGTPGASLRADRASGLARLQLPAGDIQVAVDHHGSLSSLRLSSEASLVGLACSVLLAIFAFSRFGPEHERKEIS